MTKTEDRYTTDLYFEAHVTVDPVTSYGDVFDEIVKEHGFRRAEFLYKKTGAVARPDDFLTARSTSWEQICDQTYDLVYELGKTGYKVRRYKIENTLLDVRL